MRKEMENFCHTKPDYECSLMIFKFEAVSRYEEKLGKLCEDFSVEEIIEFYKSLQTTSYSVLKVYNTYLNSFCKYINAVGNFENITTEHISQCVNLELIHSNLVSREDLLEIIKQFANVSEKAICLCLFEGICGKGYGELADITADAINGNTITLSSGRKLDISDELVALIKKSCGEYSYYAYTKSGDIDTRSFREDSKTMIKELSNTRALDKNDYFTKRKRMYSVLLRIRKNTESECVDSTNLRESGRIDMIRKLLAQGKEIEEVLRDPNLEYRYGKIANKQYFIELYKDYIREE